MNHAYRENLMSNKGGSPALIVSPADIDMTKMLGYTNCTGQIMMGFEFTLMDTSQAIKDILKLSWEMVLAINNYHKLGLSFVQEVNWQVGIIGQAVEAGLLEYDVEGWSSFLPVIVTYSLSKEDLNIN